MVAVQQDDRGFRQPKIVELVQDSANLKARGLCFGVVCFGDVVIMQLCQHESSTASSSREEWAVGGRRGTWGDRVSVLAGGCYIHEGLRTQRIHLMVHPRDRRVVCMACSLGPGGRCIVV